MKHCIQCKNTHFLHLCLPVLVDISYTSSEILYTCRQFFAQRVLLDINLILLENLQHNSTHTVHIFNIGILQVYRGKRLGFMKRYKCVTQSVNNFPTKLNENRLKKQNLSPHQVIDVPTSKENMGTVDKTHVKEKGYKMKQTSKIHSYFRCRYKDYRLDLRWKLLKVLVFCRCLPQGLPHHSWAFSQICTVVLLGLSQMCMVLLKDVYRLGPVLVLGVLKNLKK